MSFYQRVSESLRRVAAFGRASAIFVLVAIATAWTNPPVHCATVVIGEDGGPVIVAGSLQIYPSFVMAIEHNSNLLYLDTEKIPTWARSIAPGIAIELPFSHSLFRLGYTLSTRNYGLSKSQWINTQTAQFDLSLGFGNGAAVVIHDDFHLGVLDTQVGDPGGELPFRGQRYQANFAEMSVGHKRTDSHEVSLRVRSISTTYLKPFVTPSFDQAAGSIAAVGLWRVQPRAWVQWEVEAGTAQLTRELSTVGATEQRTEHEFGLLLGTGWELSNDTVLQFRVGPKRASYDAAVPSNFRGLVGSLVAQNASASGTQWSVGLARDVFASAYGLNNYFVSQLVTVRAERPRGTTLRFGGSMAYYLNDYPTDPRQRSDRIGGVETWMGIRQGLWVEWRVFVRYDQRSSTIPGLDYTAFRFGAGLVVGR